MSSMNAASHNTPGEKTGPVTGPPPEADDKVKSDILEAANADSSGQHAPGKDGGDKNEGKKVKSEKELEKERQKAEKLAKFEAKKAKLQQQKQQTNGEAAPSTKVKSKPKAELRDKAAEEYKEETPRGQKKILKPIDLSQKGAVVPKAVESAWYDWWEAEGYFKPEFGPDNKVKPEGSFVIAIPPPNVTGALHCGHALATALQDTLIRWHRMRGFTTLYIPGCDHAGIATQSVIENMLWRRQNKTRHDLGRAKFIETTQEWKEEYHAKITGVLKRLGASLDWSREAFTMDANLSEAVKEAFVRLHDEGYIYRANRLVNWCPKLTTALSNIEVDQKEIERRTLLSVPGYDRKVEFGVLTYFKYPIDGSDETIEVATTRPETMLGDTGVAVNPKDERYKHLVGKKARHPFIEGRLLPIVADDYVDKEFGTGAVKLTPAHDNNDFELGKRHKLEFINIMTDTGLMNENTGPFKGKNRWETRYDVVAELEKKGLFVKKEDNPMKIPLCSRSKDVIEPLMKPQWWMRMREMADDAIKVVQDGDIKLQPDSAKSNFYAWLKDVQDWCLSRQLWWGHQIPAYYVEIEGESDDRMSNERWVTGRTDAEAQEKANKKFPNTNFSLKRDEDVLDTWFSSGLWPFSTLGWPKDTHDYRELFPTTVMETGWDILTFWVIRMIIFSRSLTGQIPFKEVYCHSLIRDSEGRKMSKSLGNVIDPLDAVEGVTLQGLHDKLRTGNLDPKEIKNAEQYQKSAFPQGIPECGADALRLALVQYSSGGGDILFDVKELTNYRRFLNKIYQATKYVLLNLPKEYVPRETAKLTGNETLAEKWILHKFTIASRDINKYLEEREFSHASRVVYHYWWSALCDNYIENSKTIIQEGNEVQKRSAIDTLYTALEGALTMLHPFMPFISEELWQRLPRRPGDKTPSIVVAKYPQYEQSFNDPASEEAYDLLLICSHGIRNLRAQYSMGTDIAAYVQPLDKQAYETCSQHSAVIRTLSGRSPTPIKDLTVLSPTDAKPKGCAVFPASSQAVVYVYVKGLIDIDQEIEKSKERLNQASKAVTSQRKVVERMQGTASAAIVEDGEKNLRDCEAEVRVIEESIQYLNALKLEDS